MLILGARYGSIDPTSGKSYIELEYEYAVERKKPLFAAVMTEEYLEEKVKSKGTAVIERDHPDQYKAFRNTVLKKMSRFFGHADAVKLIVHESLPQLIRDRNLVGWIRGADAKTIEDVEELRRAEQKVRELQDELTRRSSDDSEYFERFAQGDEQICVECRVGKNDTRSWSFSWDELFLLLGKALLTNPGVQQVKKKLESRLAEILGIEGLTTIKEEHFTTIQTQFLALGYIDIEQAYQQAGEHTAGSSQHFFFTDKYHPKWVTSWRLTERGQRKLASLAAIRSNMTLG
jgi:hypothetical protein